MFELYENIKPYKKGMNIEPGYGYFNMPDDVYHSSKCPGLSRSTMVKTAFAPQEAMRPQNRSDALEFGTMFHMFINEPKVFPSRYAVEPERPPGLKLTTKEGREWKEKYLAPVHSSARLEGMEICSSSDFRMLLSMKASLYLQPLFDEYNNGFKEVTFVNYLNIGGEKVLFKVKLDSLNLNTMSIYDLKTTKNWQPRRIAYDKSDRFLGIQAALYTLITESVLTGLPERLKFKWVHVEKQEHYPCVVFDEMDKHDFIQSCSELEHCYDLYKENEANVRNKHPKKQQSWLNIGFR